MNKEITRLPPDPSTDCISSLLRLLQTLLTVLTHNGELLLNCSLFPHIQSFLTHPSTLSLLATSDVKVITWYFTCIRYLSYHNETLLDRTYSMNTTLLIQFIQSCKEQEIPLACNCVRVLFPRQFFSLLSFIHRYLKGFGPYPTSAFPIINKHNSYKNETPTSIAMFPLSLVYNLHGMYLTNHSFQNGTIVSFLILLE